MITISYSSRERESQVSLTLPNMKQEKSLPRGGRRGAVSNYRAGATALDSPIAGTAQRSHKIKTGVVFDD
jgi:hypothetical protein